MRKHYLTYKILIVLFVSITAFAHAQNTTEKLDSIKNETQLLFDIPSDDSLKLYTIHNISLEGNNKTKATVIWRELPYRRGDQLAGNKIYTVLEDGRENLRNLSLFNFVHVSSSLDDSCEKCINVRIRFIEQWYIWPFPIFEVADRNFNTWWKKKDLSRLNYGVLFEHKNFLGLNQKLKLLLRFGHDQKYELSYYNPFLNRAQTLGFGIRAGANMNHETAYKTDDNNEELYYEDENKYVKKSYYFGIEFTYRKDIYNTHVFSARYIMNRFADSLVILNPNYSIDQKTSINYTQLFYMFRSDHRNYKHYPLKGWYFDIRLTKDGLPGLEDLDLLNAISTYRRYWQLDQRWHFATGFTGKVSTKGFQPYFAQQGLGYGRDFVRGYELYVIDGQDFALAKTNLKFSLIQPRVHRFGFIPNEKFNTIHFAFYINCYLDAGYVWDNELHQQNELDEELLLGGGIGLDLVTYYDKVLRFEYSVNKLGEGGIFIHFLAPI